ncbi:MAG: hypothetical protein J0H31_20405, partial [Alphaproteobacteria bacterium]|nr:hypothetical protein [Alphaproteobacteria bacterium]
MHGATHDIGIDVGADQQASAGLVQGVDVRPSLLRVLTDLYVQQPQRHTDEEERQYAELARRLLPVVDKATRVTVATKLASYPFAPATVIEQLSRDVAEVA